DVDAYQKRIIRGTDSDAYNALASTANDRALATDILFGCAAATAGASAYLYWFDRPAPEGGPKSQGVGGVYQGRFYRPAARIVSGDRPQPDDRLASGHERHRAVGRADAEGAVVSVSRREIGRDLGRRRALDSGHCGQLRLWPPRRRRGRAALTRREDPTGSVQ